jgi:hypothetical protein
VLVSNYYDNEIAWYENGGQISNPTFTKRVITTTAIAPYAVHSADIDGDGDLDVLAAIAEENMVAWYENGGNSSNPTFIERVITTTANSARSVYAADIDGDGDMDVLSASDVDDTIAWYENSRQSSNPTFTKRIITDTTDYATFVYAADIDGDGDLDVLSASRFDKTIAWYENYRFSFLNCETGKYYGVINGLSACISCAVGSYQNETGKSSCKSCPIGSYQNQIGQSICISCPIGTNNTLEGRTSLSSCKKPKKHYKDFLFMDL